MTKKDLTFEEAIRDFEETINQLNRSDLSIDEAIKIYEDGLKKYKVCEDILNNASQKIEIYKKKQEEENV